MPSSSMTVAIAMMTALVSCSSSYSDQPYSDRSRRSGRGTSRKVSDKRKQVHVERNSRSTYLGLIWTPEVLARGFGPRCWQHRSPSERLFPKALSLRGAQCHPLLGRGLEP